MTDTGAGAAPLFTTTHVGDWAIVHVASALDATSWAALKDYVTPMLTWGAQVALVLRGAPTDDAAAVPALEFLWGTAADLRAHLTVVEPDPATRTRWHHAGLTRVHESLDEALRDTAPALGAGQADEPLMPAAGDALLVSTDDISGNEPRL
jgi:anti-anti-sigma regulatory factor